MLNPLRHQLPAYSPISLRSILKALPQAVGGVPDPIGGLEALLRERHPGREVVLVGSGTQALTLALQLASQNLDPATPIALPAYSCFDVATAAVALGRPVDFYDLDPVSLGPDPSSLEAVLGRGARVVVLAPLFGMPLDWGVLDPVLARGGEMRGEGAGSGAGEGVRVIEDAAQGFGGEWAGAPLGSQGHLGILSFGRGKGWTGGGAGGALLMPEEEWGRAMEVLEGVGMSDLRAVEAKGGEAIARTGTKHGVTGTKAFLQAVGLWGLARPGIYRVPRSLPLGLGETRYREPEPIRPLSQAEAALVLAAYSPALAAVETRRRVAREYGQDLEDLAARGGGPFRVPVVPPAATPGYLRFPLRPFQGMEAFRYPEQARRLGVETGYPRILPDLMSLKALVEDGGSQEVYPGAVALRDGLITLPTHPRTRKGERRRLVEMLRL